MTTLRPPPHVPPPKARLTLSRRERYGWGLSLIVHVVVILAAIVATRDSSIWDDPERAPRASVPGGGGGGVRMVSLPSLSPPPPPPTAPTPPVVVRPRVRPPVTPPVQVPVPPPLPPKVDSVPSPSSGSTTGGTGGGTGGGAGPGAGPGTGAGTGPGSGRPGAPAPDSTRLRGTPPEPIQLVIPPFPYPKTLRGTTVTVNFFVQANGRVDHVVLAPEVPDRGYAKKFEEAMRAYRFRPARSPDGAPVPGVSVVNITF